MRNFIFLLLIIVLAQVGISCNNKYNKHIQELKKINSNIREGKWVESQHYKTAYEELFQLYMSKNDTIYNLLFVIRPKNEYIIGEYQVRYSDEKYNYNILMESSDTLYFYKEDKITNTKIFTYGKYYYLYLSKERFKLSQCQLNYLLENLDSLMFIKGDIEFEFPCSNEKTPQIDL